MTSHLLTLWSSSIKSILSDLLKIEQNLSGDTKSNTYLCGTFLFEGQSGTCVKYSSDPLYLTLLWVFFFLSVCLWFFSLDGQIYSHTGSIIFMVPVCRWNFSSQIFYITSQQLSISSQSKVSVKVSLRPWFLHKMTGHNTCLTTRTYWKRDTSQRCQL